MRFVRIALTLLVAGAGAGVSACASSQPPVSAPSLAAPLTSSAPSPPGSPAAAAAVPDALKFTATTVDGKTFDAATLAGKPTVFWFWAAWCPKCKGDAAAVRDLQAAAATKVNVVGVAGLRSGSDGMRKFVADFQLASFPQLADDKGDVWKRFDVPTQHYYVILDGSGQVVHRGPLTVDQLRKTVGV